jgi:hypothetical protein
MKKICYILLVILNLSVTPLLGQMILTEEDVGINPRAAKSYPDNWVMVPVQNVTYDQWNYAPLSDGLLLLVGLGGAYLLKKKRSQK